MEDPDKAPPTAMPNVVPCPYCDAKFLEGDEDAQMRHMDTAHADIIAQRLAEAGRGPVVDPERIQA